MLIVQGCGSRIRLPDPGSEPPEKNRIPFRPRNLNRWIRKDSDTNKKPVSESSLINDFFSLNIN